MSASNDVFPLFQQFLREMFQFDHHELDFGLFKVLRLKRSFIEQFIDGDGEQDLRRIVSRELAANDHAIMPGWYTVAEEAEDALLRMQDKPCPDRPFTGRRVWSWAKDNRPS